MEKQTESEHADHDASQEEKMSDETGKKSERRSQRQRKKRAFSPDCEEEVKKKKRKSKPFSTTSINRPCDFLPNGEEFCCHMCKSPYVTNPHAKGVRKGKRSRHVVLPQKRLDSQGREILVCNACKQILDHQVKPTKPGKEISSERRNEYLDDAKMFAKSLAETLNDPEAESLYCPVSVHKICGCLQRYIKGKDTDESVTEKRSIELLDLLKEARKLREEKWTEDVDRGLEIYRRQKRSKHLGGLGSGHKKSKAFEDFVLQRRQYLKEEVGLCERATQKILIYSNNFLHKKLKTEGRPCRITRTKGKAALGQLLDIGTLHKNSCCNDNCVALCLSHPSLLESWRSRALSGQTEARKVIAEMLTPANNYPHLMTKYAGSNLNCHKFVSMVTGCSLGTIGKVKSQLWSTKRRLESSKQDGNIGLTGRQRGHNASAPESSDRQVPESLADQTHNNSRQEVTPEVPGPSQDQAGSQSTAIQDLVQRQQVLQQQHIVQQQIQQDLGQQQIQQALGQQQIQQALGQQQIQQALGHTPVPQIPGWLPQFAGPLTHTIGSLNPAFQGVNILQTELPVPVPTLTNLPTIQGQPGHLQPEFNQNMPPMSLNVPVVNQMGVNGASFINPGFVSVSQETFAQNSGLEYASIVSPNAIPHQHNVEVNGQSIQSTGDLMMQAQKQLQPPNYGSDITSNASLVSDFNQNRTCLPPTVTNAGGQPDGQSTELTTERNIPLANIASEVPNPPRMMLTMIDSEKGVAQQFELLPTAANKPFTLPMNSSLPTIATMTLPRGDQILSPAEQQRQVQEIMNTSSLIDIPFATNAILDNAPVQINKAHLKTSSEFNIDQNSECNAAVPLKGATMTQENSEVESNQSILTMIITTVPENENIQNQSIATQVPFQLEKVDVLFHPDQIPDTSNETLATVMVSGQDTPNVVDKSTNTTEYANRGEIGNQSIDTISDQINVNIHVPPAEYVEEREKMTSIEGENVKSISSIRNIGSSLNSELETQFSKHSHVVSHSRESRNTRKHGGKRHKSSNESQEQEFQKLHSKSGKVFLQSMAHRSVEVKGRGSDANAGDLELKTIQNMPKAFSAEKDIYKERQMIAKTATDSDRVETCVSSENDRQTAHIQVTSVQANSTPVSKSNFKKTRTKIHLTDTVKDKLRQSLNIPILPKPTTCSSQSVGRTPVGGLQPLESSLFVIPPTPPRSHTSQDITSLLHMSKSKVKIQTPVNQSLHSVSPEEQKNTARLSVSASQYEKYEPVHEKTNNLGSDQV